MTITNYQGLIHKYRDHLPIRDEAIVTLYEGNTPLLPCKRLQEKIGTEAQIYLKFEGLNPTGSFKDRGMTYAVSKAVEAGSQVIICASTGNTSASAAAYAARAGIKSVVLIPKGKIAFGKLSQALQHGSKVIQIAGNFDDALKAVIEIGENFPVSIVNSVNPHRILGQMTAAFEVIEQLGCVPDFHCIPVGNAGNISAYWAGYKKMYDAGTVKSKPRMLGFQAAGAAPLVRGKIVKKPETIASAIRIGNPASWQTAIAARDESNGIISSVTDREIIAAYKMLASLEGYFCEPASAASVAGLVKMAKQKMFTKNHKIVCTLTGHGLKDPDTAVAHASKPLTAKADVASIIKVMGLK